MSSFYWPSVISGGTVTGIGTFDSGTPSANGASISGNNLILQSASASVPGLVNTGAQTFAGNKTFTGTLTAPAFISSTANPSATGVLRLANSDSLAFRNLANTADLVLNINGANSFQFNASVDLQGTHNLTGIAQVLLSGSASGIFTMQASATTTSYTVTMPPAQGGASTFLQNNGSGVLSWVAASAAAAGSLTGTTLASNVVNSSLTSVGTLSNLTVSGSVTVPTVAAPSSLTLQTSGTTAGSISSSQVWTIGAVGSNANQLINGSLVITNTQNATSVYELDNLSSGGSAAAILDLIVGDGTTSSKLCYVQTRNRGSGNIIHYAGHLGTDDWSINTAASTSSRPFFVTAAGSTVHGSAALSTGASDGFIYIPTCAGAPTGTPTSQTGTVAHVYDTTNNRLYVYNGGAWKGVTLT